MTSQQAMSDRCEKIWGALFSDDPLHVAPLNLNSTNSTSSVVSYVVVQLIMESEDTGDSALAVIATLTAANLTAQLGVLVDSITPPSVETVVLSADQLAMLGLWPPPMLPPPSAPAAGAVNALVLLLVVVLGVSLFTLFTIAILAWLRKIVRRRTSEREAKIIPASGLHLPEDDALGNNSIPQGPLALPTRSNLLPDRMASTQLAEGTSHIPLGSPKALQQIEVASAAVSLPLETAGVMKAAGGRPLSADILLTQTSHAALGGQPPPFSSLTGQPPPFSSPFISEKLLSCNAPRQPLQQSRTRAGAQLLGCAARKHVDQTLIELPFQPPDEMEDEIESELKVITQTSVFPPNAAFHPSGEASGRPRTPSSQPHCLGSVGGGNGACGACDNFAGVWADTPSSLPGGGYGDGGNGHSGGGASSGADVPGSSVQFLPRIPASRITSIIQTRIRTNGIFPPARPTVEAQTPTDTRPHTPSLPALLPSPTPAVKTGSTPADRIEYLQDLGSHAPSSPSVMDTLPPSLAELVRPTTGVSVASFGMSRPNTALRPVSPSGEIEEWTLPADNGDAGATDVLTVPVDNSDAGDNSGGGDDGGGGDGGRGVEDGFTGARGGGGGSGGGGVALASEEKRAQLRKAFAAFDADGSGAISVSELENILAMPVEGKVQRTAEQARKEAEMVIAKYDTNGGKPSAAYLHSP